MDVQFQYWITITFAVIVAAFVAGRRVSQGLRRLMAMLYLLASLALAARFLRFDSISQSALENLGDHAFVDALNNEGYILPISRMLLYLLGTSAAVWFLLRKDPLGD
ncbi:MAG: hypothetical protein HKN84_08620 [Gammaproteobacteria bacterium]|nr:hypothetical protein [Gammaproteobacteria bacterium]